LALFFAFFSKADTAETTNDLVTFFKQAMSSPPDVENYVVGQRVFGEGDTMFYNGARSGSNYFLKILSASNAPVNLDQADAIAGRSGSSAYWVSQNAVSYGIGSNGLTGNVEQNFFMAQQFLSMGISETASGVKWSNNTFTATVWGHPRYGELSISNGIPSRLEISLAKGSPPYKVVEYTYPDPPTALSGFPSKMKNSSTGPNGKLKSFCEIQFYSIQLAARPLYSNFFASAQFIGPNILHTNVYSNADLYVQTKRGRTVKSPDSLVRKGVSPQ
jgi:hypothetical protein